MCIMVFVMCTLYNYNMYIFWHVYLCVMILLEREIALHNEVIIDALAGNSLLCECDSA